jgi:acetyl esterase/lipase
VKSITTPVSDELLQAHELFEIMRFLLGPLVGWNFAWVRFALGKPSGYFSKGVICDLYHLADKDLLPQYNVEVIEEECPAPGSVWIKSSALKGGVSSPTSTLCIMYLHGGGWVSGNAQIWNASLSLLSRKTGNALVCSVEYPLAPEASVQSQLETILATFEWLVKEKGQHQIVIAGDSAGGGLAALALQKLRGRQEAVGGVLISPAVDMTFSSDCIKTNDDTDLILSNSGFVQLRTIQRALLQNTQHTQETYASAELSSVYGSWAGLPPLYIWNAECEMLRDDGLRVAALAKEAGVRVEHEVTSLCGYTCCRDFVVLSFL